MKLLTQWLIAFMLMVLAWCFLLPREQQTRNKVDGTKRTNDIEVAESDSMFNFWNDLSDTVTFPAFEQPLEAVHDTLVISFEVTVTVYNAIESQCDTDPSQLASGKRIKTELAGSYRYCALSRNLLKRWGGPISYGDTLTLEGAKHLSGQWIVEDTMHSRFRDRMDLLVDVNTRPYKFNTATITKEL